MINDLLQRIDSYKIINHYLKTFHSFPILKQGQHISNPFLKEKQKTPSFNIYQTNNGVWRYKDFATNDDGSVIDLIQKLRGCSFKQAIIILKNDFPEFFNDENFNKTSLNLKNHWTKEDLEFWNQYGINREILMTYEVSPVVSYSIKNKFGNYTSFKSNKDNPAFAYKINDDCYKLYFPKRNKYRFMWIGTKPKEYVFGFKNLHNNTKLFITGGEKDVMTLRGLNQNAICFNSETSIPSEDLIYELKEKFPEIIVLYDIDRTGKKFSFELSKMFGLKRMLLPEELASHKGKDISDFIKLGNTLSDPEIELESYSQKRNLPFLDQLLTTQKVISSYKSRKISFTQPLLKLNDINLIFPNTINIIQGKAGTHKSRLAEMIGSALINRNLTRGLFSRNKYDKLCLRYVDTERNLKEQFPFAIQQILKRAGYLITDEPSNFNFISLLEIKRSERFKALSNYLEYEREKSDSHLVVILDVISDCILDFNKAEESLELIDLMNEAINKSDITFIAVIHENPGQFEKARGHLGSELINKATTILQVSLAGEIEETKGDLIKLKFLKTRNTKNIPPIYLQYDDKSHGLSVAESTRIDHHISHKQKKAKLNEIKQYLIENLSTPVSGKLLIERLSIHHDCSSKVIRTRLKSLLNKNIALENEDQKLYLKAERLGQNIIYRLE